MDEEVKSVVGSVGSAGTTTLSGAVLGTGAATINGAGLGSAETSSMTQKTTVTTEVTVQPPKEVSVVLATMTAFWDWFDKRDVDKHFVAFLTLIVSWIVIKWSMSYADLNHERSGVDIAAVLAAINVPITAFQAAVVKWYFNARTTGE